MKIKILVFLGIVLCGLVISLLTLNTCQTDTLSDGPAVADAGDGGKSKQQAGAGFDSGSSEAGQSGESGARSDRADGAAGGEGMKTPNLAPAPRTGGGDRPAGSEQRPDEGSRAMAADDSSAAGGSREVTPIPSRETLKKGPAVVRESAEGMVEEFQSGDDSPENVVGEVANAIVKKDFRAFMAAVGTDRVPGPLRDRLKALIEDPGIEFSPTRPFWEIAKQSDAVRWMIELSRKTGDADTEMPKSIVLDISRVAPGKYEISGVSLSPTVRDVVRKMEEPEGAGSEVDSLTMAHAFSTAVLSEDFAAARKFSEKNVTDERIAGLMIALEEGGFRLREDRPLIVTLARDTVTWVLARVTSDEETSEFALELGRETPEESWKVNGLTFGKVIRTLASDVDGPYSPLVEDPGGGESLVVYFDFDEAGLTSRAAHQMKIVAGILRQDSDRRIRITGHADALGTDVYNRMLSEKRAEAIRQAIIAQGIEPSQVITEGYGETRPRKPNFKADGSDNPLGRSENRRAEVYLDF